MRNAAIFKPPYVQKICDRFYFQNAYTYATLLFRCTWKLYEGTSFLLVHILVQIRDPSVTSGCSVVLQRDMSSKLVHT